MAYVYGHKRLDKNHFFYIGIGNDKKYQRANKNTQRTKYWHNIVNKTQYEVEIIEDNLTWEQACEREKYWIKFYGRKDLKEGSLINLTDGGEGAVGVIRSKSTREKLSKKNKGRKLTSEQIKKISESLKGRISPRKGVRLTEETKQKIREKRKLQITTEETKKKMSEVMKGRVMSEEWKQKISKSNTGKKLSEETKKKIADNNWMKGKSGKLPEEYLKKLSEAQKRRWQNTKNLVL